MMKTHRFCIKGGQMSKKRRPKKVGFLLLSRSLLLKGIFRPVIFIGSEICAMEASLVLSFFFLVRVLHVKVASPQIKTIRRTKG